MAMSWDALRDRDSNRPRKHNSDRISSVTPQARSQNPRKGSSLTPKSKSIRAATSTPPQVQVVPATIEEELWFGGHDSSIAEDTAARSMAALVGRIVGAKPFPESARKLAELTRKDVLRIEPIIQVLERDPGLSARLLRLVNSAGYALRQRCTSVRHAATLVGTDRLHQIATTAAVLDLFDAKGSVAAKIVEHSTIVGAFCRYFGAHLALPVDDLFTAGFLHDIGKLMLLETEGDQYFSLLEQYGDKPDAIHVVERSLFGFDHAVLAAHVLTEWNIPDPVPKIVAWHHDPTRAYRVSSMMAALVQTVRLADLAVYAMVNGADQEHFSTLASTESASYLDISEPQLSSMWDELQTLYRESIEQCRGENAPALDPRSLRPKQPINISVIPEVPRSTELPLQFPCVVCGKPSFGNKCQACGGHMCPEHQEGRDDWCSLCARDFRREAEENLPIISNNVAIFVAIAVVLISTSIGYETGGYRGGIRATIGTLLILILAFVLMVVGRRLFLRFRFVRSRPDRAVDEAQESDGGLQSLVPPTNQAILSRGDTSHVDPLTEQLRLSGRAIERVMIREIPSVPSILAPKPFEGLTEAHPPSSRKPETTSGSVSVPTTTVPQFPGSFLPPITPQTRVDDERLAQQGRSLVTLPVPARSMQDTPIKLAEPVPANEAPRRPSASAVPIDPSESIDINSDERNSELGLNALPATPQSEPPASSSPLAPHSQNSNSQARLSGTYPSQPPESTEDVSSKARSHGESQHPLAALGLNPNKYGKPAIEDTHALKVEHAPEPIPRAESSVGDRQTLLGISASDIRAAIEAEKEPVETAPITVDSTPKVLERTLDEVQENTSSEPVEANDSTTSAPEFAPEVGTFASPPELPVNNVVVEPLTSAQESAIVAAPQFIDNADVISLPDVSAPTASQVDSVNAESSLTNTVSIEQQVLASMGPEFQSQVMNLVAEKVAAIVAERMLESLGQGAVKVQTSPKGRAPKEKKTPPSTDTKTAATSPKTSRRKAHKE
jgi:HD-like signal output (HDOD) protein